MEFLIHFITTCHCHEFTSNNWRVDNNYDEHVPLLLWGIISPSEIRMGVIRNIVFKGIRHSTINSVIYVRRFAGDGGGQFKVHSWFHMHSSDHCKILLFNGIEFISSECKLLYKYIFGL